MKNLNVYLLACITFSCGKVINKNCDTCGPSFCNKGLLNEIKNLSDPKNIFKDSLDNDNDTQNNIQPNPMKQMQNTNIQPKPFKELSNEEQTNLLKNDSFIKKLFEKSLVKYEPEKSFAVVQPKAAPKPIWKCKKFDICNISVKDDEPFYISDVPSENADKEIKDFAEYIFNIRLPNFKEGDSILGTVSLSLKNIATSTYNPIHLAWQIAHCNVTHSDDYEDGNDGRLQ